MAFSIQRVTALPDAESRINNCMYLVKPEGSNAFDTYMVSEAGDLISGFNEERVRGFVESFNGIFDFLFYAEDIAARDALTLTQNCLIMVKDATTDPTVTTGFAMYFYLSSTKEFVKIIELESLDISLSWNSLVGKPLATPIQIDSAVQKAHVHQNEETLAGFSDIGDGLKYNGQLVSNVVFNEGVW